MRFIGFAMLLVVLLSTAAMVSGARSSESKGAVWLAARSTEAAGTNVSGVWQSRAWGAVKLQQAEGTREVTGYGDGWEVIGVVSGKKVSLLFCQVQYSMELTLDSDNSLKGGYTEGLMKAGARGTAVEMKK